MFLVAPDPTLLLQLKQTKPFASLADEGVVALLATADLYRRRLGETVAVAGLTLQQYNVLRILRGAGAAGLPTLEIAERMIEQAPGVTRLLDRLEAKRLVDRERCQRDRRQVFCRIGAQGLTILAELDAPIEATNRELTVGATEADLDHLINTLARLRAAVGAGRVVSCEAAPAGDTSTSRP